VGVASRMSASLRGVLVSFSVCHVGLSTISDAARAGMCAMEMPFSGTFVASTGSTDLLRGFTESQKIVFLVSCNFVPHVVAANDVC
jgi:hypothetical protein